MVRQGVMDAAGAWVLVALLSSHFCASQLPGCLPAASQACGQLCHRDDSGYLGFILSDCSGSTCEKNISCRYQICPNTRSSSIGVTLLKQDHPDGGSPASHLVVNGRERRLLQGEHRTFDTDPSGCLSVDVCIAGRAPMSEFGLEYWALGHSRCGPALHAAEAGSISVDLQACGDRACGPLLCSYAICPAAEDAHSLTLDARLFNFSCGRDALLVGDEELCAPQAVSRVLPLPPSGCLEVTLQSAGGSESSQALRLTYHKNTPACGELLRTADSGVVTVPLDCEHSCCRNVMCNYRLCPASKPKAIALASNGVAVASADVQCPDNYLSVRGVQYFQDSGKWSTIFGLDSSGCLRLSFRSGHRFTGIGFTISYSAYSERCGILHHTAHKGKIAPKTACSEGVCDRMNCTYVICPKSPSTHVQLTHVITSNSTNCTEEYVDLGPTRVCPSSDASPELFPLDASGCLNFTFVSRGAAGSSGFYIDYTAVDHSSPSLVMVIITLVLFVGAIAVPVGFAFYAWRTDGRERDEAVTADDRATRGLQSTFSRITEFMEISEEAGCRAAYSMAGPQGEDWRGSPLEQTPAGLQGVDHPCAAENIYEELPPWYHENAP